MKKLDYATPEEYMLATGRTMRQAKLYFINRAKLEQRKRDELLALRPQHIEVSTNVVVYERDSTGQYKEIKETVFSLYEAHITLIR